MAKRLMKIGDDVADFILKDQDGNDVRLGDLRGKWVVLYFYPKDDTPGCTTEACEFTQIRKDLDDMDVQVIGISPDSPESHREFIRKHKLNLTLLSDPEHKVIEQFGAWGVKEGRDYEGVNRTTALVDPDGRLMYNWEKVRAEGHAREVMEKSRDFARRGPSSTRKSPGTTQQG